MQMKHFWEILFVFSPTLFELRKERPCKSLHDGLPTRLKLSSGNFCKKKSAVYFNLKSSSSRPRNSPPWRKLRHLPWITMFVFAHFKHNKVAQYGFFGSFEQSWIIYSQCSTECIEVQQIPSNFLKSQIVCSKFRSWLLTINNRWYLANTIFQTVLSSFKWPGGIFAVWLGAMCSTSLDRPAAR